VTVGAIVLIAVLVVIDIVRGIDRAARTTTAEPPPRAACVLADVGVW
jgi:hypothetical protein